MGAAPITNCAEAAADRQQCSLFGEADWAGRLAGAASHTRVNTMEPLGGVEVGNQGVPNGGKAVR